MGSSTFPDPKDMDFEALRSIIQRSQPEGLTVGSVDVQRLSLSSYVWNVKYHWKQPFPDPREFKCTLAKSILQRQCPSGGKVCAVTVVYSITNEAMWNVQYKKKQSILNTLIKFVPCLSSLTPKNVKYQVFESDKLELINFEDLTKQHRVRKVFLGDKDVTRKLCGKTRISTGALIGFFKKHNCCISDCVVADIPTPKIDDRTVFPSLVQPSSSTSPTVVKPSLQLRTNPQPSGSSNILSITDEHSSTVTALVTGPSSASFNSIPPPRTYARMCELAKLRESRILQKVTEYLSIEYGRVEGKRYKTITHLRGKSLFLVELDLKSDGLPLGRDLFELFIDYCTSHGKSRSAALSELNRIRFTL